MKSRRAAARLGASLVVVCLLGACGQRGPLVLPKPPDAPPTSKSGKARAPSPESAPPAAPDTR
ncbi:MAG: hypothetical protein KGQ67_01070 [Betaproteobacteria bacterium]|nr:hypothetical protein [Betaproteobacteria bacterium]